MTIVYTRKRLRAPPPTELPPTPRRSAKKKRYTQLFIDAGQKDLVKTCSICAMVYTPGRDDAVHNRYHRESNVQLPRWSPRTSSEAVGSFEGVEIHVMKQTCEKTARRIDLFVSGVLGTVLDFPSLGWVAVVAVMKGLVRGFCLVERIQSARMLQFCGVPVSGGEEKAIMGVRKIWVEPQFRGKRIATRLLEEACLTLVYGHVVERRFVAFSVPTEDGTKFANKFCDGRVLIYDTTDVDRAAE